MYRFRYAVVFSFTKDNGDMGEASASITRPKPIRTQVDLESVANQIKKEGNFSGVCITNFFGK